ncbi:complement factor H-related protein 1-like isoform X4 [Pantherophis guttatus]|uniref:Complement factor H-related protein 1-like isoform X4 n=1 Tax=Pantherophis guttatus TaxID=94885 RepID=A0ABM3ZCI7_PANGU|nr:complement factor H-related protein 1-like isoform X4 [Pantherophis guttatus]
MSSLPRTMNDETQLLFLLSEKCDTSLRIHNGHFASTYQDMYIEGNDITFVCDQGYSPANQQSTSTCTKNGWSPAPSCILTERGCDYIRIENGRMAKPYELYRPFPISEGQSIYFSCNHGFLPTNKEMWQAATCIKSHYVPELKCFRIFSCKPAVNIHLHKKWLVTCSKLYPDRSK